MHPFRTFPLWVALTAALPAQVQTGSWTGLNAGDQFGSTIVPYRDVDGDGTVDLLVGSPTWDYGPQSNAGRVDLRSGRSGGILRSHHGTNGNDWFGSSIAVIGDANHDGVEDYAIGVPGADNGYSDCGSVVAFSGASGAQLWRTDGYQDYAYRGSSLARIMDYDGDGVVDCAVGAPTDGNQIHWNASAVFLLSGASGFILRSFYAATCEEQYGAAVALVGDLDSDGYEELAIGAPGSYLDGGKVDIRSLHTGNSLFVIEDPTGWSRLGSVITALGDLDGDGRPDFAVGADSGYSPYVRIVLGGVMTRMHTGSQLSRFGLGLANIGDLDLDGFPDYAIGAPLGGANASGTVQVFSGRTGALRTTLTAGGANAWFGRTIQAVGDRNGDGYAEFAVGMPLLGNGEVRFHSLSVPPVDSTFGSSCGLTSVEPQLRLQSGGAIGTNVLVRYNTGSIANGLGVMLVGWSNTSHNGAPLPLSLGSFGLPGCQLLVSPAANLVVAQTNQIGYVSLGTPQGSAMLGLSLYCQYALFQSNTIAFTTGLGVRFGTPF